MEIKTVTVYASSSERVDEVYKRAGFALGEAIARRGWVQVNGGGSTGLMKTATDGGLAAGGAVRAVILRHFLEGGYLHPKLDDVLIEDEMPGRKRGLYELGDAYIALPGGLGTFEEVLEVLSWRQLGFHDKPLALLDVEGFYEPLVRLIEQSAERRFVAPGFGSAWFCSSDIDAVLAWLEGYEPEAFDISSKV